MIARELDELGRAEAVMADFDHVAQLGAADLMRQQSEEGVEVGSIELFRRRELPKHRPQLVAELQRAGIDETLDRVARLGEHTPVDGVARPLEGKDEARGRLARPLGERCRRLRAIEGAVDLYGRHVLGRVGELFGVRQLVGIERPAPGLEGPSAHPGTDVSAGCHIASVRAWRRPADATAA